MENRMFEVFFGLNQVMALTAAGTTPPRSDRKAMCADCSFKDHAQQVQSDLAPLKTSVLLVSCTINFQ